MQMQTTAKIKKMEVEKGSTGLKFKELKLTSNQVQQVNDLINGDEEVLITIEPSQPGLFDQQQEFKTGDKVKFMGDDGFMCEGFIVSTDDNQSAQVKVGDKPLENVGFERLTKIEEAKEEKPAASGKKKSKGKKKDGKKAASGEKDD